MKTVFVLGELNVDLIATAGDITPEFNREKLLDTFDVALGSSSAITACALAGLGLEVIFVGVVGDDQFGRFVLEQLRLRGVDTGYIRVDPALKTGVTLSLSNARDRALLTYMGSIPCLRREHLPKELPDRADHIHFGSYYLQEGMRGHWPELFAEARSRGATTSFDTGWDPHERWHRDEIAELLRHTDWFIPSEDEVKQIIGSDCLDDIPAKLPAGHGRIAVKRGAAGSLYLDRDGTKYEAPAYPVRPVDTTGAGDSFNAGLIYGFLTDLRGRELLDFANACGALATLRLGGASSVPAKEEVDRFIAGRGAVDYIGKGERGTGGDL